MCDGRCPFIYLDLEPVKRNVEEDTSRFYLFCKNNPLAGDLPEGKEKKLERRKVIEGDQRCKYPQKN